MVPPPERLADDREPTSNLSRWMGAWSEYAEAWGSSFSDKDPRPGALAPTPQASVQTLELPTRSCYSPARSHVRRRTLGSASIPVVLRSFAAINRSKRRENYGDRNCEVVQRREGVRLHRARRRRRRVRPLFGNPEGRLPHPRGGPAGRVRHWTGQEGRGSTERPRDLAAPPGAYRQNANQVLGAHRSADLRLTSAHRTRAQNVGDESRQARHIGHICARVAVRTERRLWRVERRSGVRR